MHDDFKKWLSDCDAKKIMWVIDMAKKGISATPGAGNDPMNVFLYDIETRCSEYLETHDY